MSILNIIKYIEPLHLNSLCSDAISIFSNQSARIIPISDNYGNIIGILERSPFLSRIAQSFGRDLFGKRAVSHLMKPANLIFDKDIKIDKAAMAISDYQGELEMPCAIVIHDGKYFGIADASDVFKELAICWNERASELQKAKRQVESANKAKSAFLAAMSHEIRTPLNAIIGMATSIKDSNLNDDQKEKIDIISDSGGVLLRVVNDVLDMSRIDNGNLEIIPFECDLYKALMLTKNLYENLAIEKSLYFDYNIDDLIGINVNIDGKRLQQILFNLISNSIKFTNQGGINVNAIIKNEKLILNITDTGIGMDEKFIEKIGEPFLQADNNVTRQYGGTGLGLCIAKKLVGLLGGRLKIKSCIGIGSSFTIKLPLQIIKKPVVLEANEEGDVSTLKILVVEDNLTNQKVINALLSQFELDLTFADNGEIGLELFKTKRFDLILMDIQMPVMDGLTATKEIRKHESLKAVEPIPIIAVSANAMPHHVSEAIAAGMNDHVAKPIILDTLMNAIDNAIFGTEDELQSEKCA